MALQGKVISEIGEKALISSFLIPLLNPSRDPSLAGDDCAFVKTDSSNHVCISTDRVPHDLISFRLKLIGYAELGRYLAILNISDLAAMGAEPRGLLLNLGLPPEMRFDDFRDFIEGAKEACDEYGCKIIGGDLSSCPVLSVSATSIGICITDPPILRRGAMPGDRVFCTAPLGITSTSFCYHLKSKVRGLKLSSEQESRLLKNFNSPRAYIESGRVLNKYGGTRKTCMDNTDGAAQTLTELASANNCAFLLFENRLPFDDISPIIANFLRVGLLDVILGPGADFQLIGTYASDSPFLEQLKEHGFYEIGEVRAGTGVYIERTTGEKHAVDVPGWNYFTTEVE